VPEKLASFLADGGLEYLFDPGAVAAVEWADRVAQFLPPSTLWVELAMATGGGRTVRLSCERAGDFPFLAEAEKMS
jgi:tRNA A37 threonylcarbamoyladenosine biosynthesis protein TsaE